MEAEGLLKDYIKRLRIPVVGQNYKDLAREAETNRITYEEYLENLLEKEVVKREESQMKRLINQARFPLKKTLDTFDFDEIPSLNKAKVLALARGDFIKDKENIILAGNSGTGKSHIGIALGLCACQKGYRVGFYTAAGLVNELTEMESQKKLIRFKKQWLNYDLVIVDELGYIPFKRESSELLFQMFSTRYERGSMIVTTNLEFSEWNQVFGDVKMTSALLDRLTHNAHILVMNGPSYRFKQSMQKKQLNQ